MADSDWRDENVEFVRDSDLTPHEKWYGYVSQSKREQETIDTDTLRVTSRMKAYEPPKASWTLRLAVSGVCVLLLCIGVSYAWAAYVSNDIWMPLVISVILIGTSGFLWMRKTWARKLASLILGVIVVLVPINLASSGIFLEFWPYYEGRLSLRIVALATTLVIVAPIFWCMYVLSKYKGTFR